MCIQYEISKMFLSPMRIPSIDTHICMVYKRRRIASWTNCRALKEDLGLKKRLFSDFWLVYDL